MRSVSASNAVTKSCTEAMMHMPQIVTNTVEEKGMLQNHDASIAAAAAVNY